MASVWRGANAHGGVGRVGGAARRAGGLRAGVRAGGCAVPSVLDS